MSVWEPFTERARRAIVLAQEEAQRLGNNYIATEHILLGIVSEGECLAAQTLETFGINLAKVRGEVEAIVGRGSQSIHQDMVFTPRSKRVIELAFEEARRFNHNYIGTEHLLLALLREQEGVAARILTNLGVDTESARTTIISLLGEAGAEPLPTRAPGGGMQLSQAVSTVPMGPAARHALAAAFEEAQRGGSPMCNLEHLLYGIAHVEESAAARFLKQKGISPLDIRGSGGTAASGVVDSEEIGYSHEVSACILKAARDARMMSREKIGVEHLLLAMTGDTTSSGSRLLQKLGVSIEALRRQLTDYLEGPDEHSPE